LVKNHKAWDALIWLGGLLTLATSLKDLGFIYWLTGNLQNSLSNFAPLIIILFLVLIYFYSMYLFSMLTAHIVALVGAIFAITININFEPIIIVALIAYFSNLSGCLTNYSTGPVIIYFGNGYSSASNWFKIGFLISLYHLIIWLGFGSLWWKVIGWW
jgi:DASS family divalent anion:Na+ symporter